MAIASCEYTQINAIRLLYAFAPDSTLPVHQGATKPLLRPSRADPEIHGITGLGGVLGLPDLDHPKIRARLEQSSHLKAIEGIANAVRDSLSHGRKLHLVASGPLTNVALFVSVYPELLSGIEQIVLMGGGDCFNFFW